MKLFSTSIDSDQLREAAVALHHAADEKDRVKELYDAAVAKINAGVADLRQLGIIK